MNKEDFIKEHPSLKGKMQYLLDEWMVDIETIDKTQTDNQKVQEICDDHFEFLQELVKILCIHKDMPANLDDWKKIIIDKIKEGVAYNQKTKNDIVNFGMDLGDFINSFKCSKSLQIKINERFGELKKELEAN